MKERMVVRRRTNGYVEMNPEVEDPEEAGELEEGAGEPEEELGDKPEEIQPGQGEEGPGEAAAADPGPGSELVLTKLVRLCI